MFLDSNNPLKEKDFKTIVRLSTSFWNDNKGCYIKKSITFLKRESKGFNFFKEDLVMVGGKEVIDRIINLNNLEDGIYEIITCNEKKDWETGCVDDYDYKLVKYEN